jgi:hypothetical protein
MATTIRELLVRLGVDADTKKVAQFDKALATTKGTLLKVAAAATVAAGAVVALAVSTARAGDEAAKAAQRVGINVEAMQELGFAAELAGADMTSIEVAFRRQAVAARDAEKSALSPSALAYKKIGVSVRDASGAMKGQLQLFEESASGIRGLKTETEKMAIANDLFGRGGSKILPLLNQGADGIRKMREQARTLGVVMDEEATKSSEKFIDAMTETKAILKGVRNQIGIALIPIFTRFVERVRDWFLMNGQVIKQRVDKVIDGITSAVGFLDRAFEKVNKRVESVGGWGVIFQQVQKVAKALVVSFGIAKLIKALGVMKAIVVGIGAIASSFSGPVIVGIGLFVAALLSVLLIGDDFLTFLRGGESVIGSFLAAFGAEEETRANFLEYLNQIKRLGRAVLAFFETLIEVFGPTDEELKAVNKEFERLVKIVKDFVNAAIGEQIADLNKKITDSIIAIDKFATALESPRELIESMLENLESFLSGVDKLKSGKVGSLLGKTVGRTPGGRLISAAGGLIPGALGGLAARGRAGLAGLGPSPAIAGAGATSNNTTVGDTNIVINAGAADAGEVARRVTAESAAARRKAYAAAQGGER